MANQELTFKSDEFIISKTNLQGKITYGNALFIQISGYDEEELIDQPHNILRHPDMPSLIFKLLWNRIKSGEEIFAYVKNKTKQNDYYWVLAHITPSLDESGNIIGYHSVRRKPHKKALDIIIPLYSQLLSAERSGGVSASEAKLSSLLLDKGVDYDKFIFTL